MDINESIAYIDGTKIEAYANKYSFVYKTRILNARTKMFFNITEDIVNSKIKITKKVGIIITSFGNEKLS